MTSGYAIATLVVFIISTSFVIRPVTIPTPRHLPRIPINLTTAPILAIALLWAAQCLDATVIRNGIVGTEGIKPYNILILFFSLAYMAITLNITGVFEAAAFWVSNMGGHNGWKLCLYLYVMLTLLSILLGNDPIILSGTAFLVYYTKAAELDSWAWVMVEFAAANTASMVLFVENPTNIVICEGIGINDAAFTAYTILPFLACDIFCFAALAFQYKNKVPRTLARTTPQVLRKALLDPVGAWVGSIMHGATLILCLVVGFFGNNVWMISLPFAVGKFLFDLTWDHYRRTHGAPLRLSRGSPRTIGKVDRFAPVDVHQRAEDTSAYCPSPDEDRSRHSLLDEVTPLHRHSLGTSGHDVTTVESQPGMSNKTKMKPQPSAPKATINMPRAFGGIRSHVDYQYDRLDAHFHTLITALSRLPFSLIPFTFSQFILVEALNHQGWVQVFANWLVRASGNQIHPTIWLIGVLGVILCNPSGTNISTVLLLTKVIVCAASLLYGPNCAATIALSVASIVGTVSFTFSASLAGLWQTMLAQKDTHLRQRDFAFWDLLPILVVTGVVVSAKKGVLFQS